MLHVVFNQKTMFIICLKIIYHFHFCECSSEYFQQVAAMK